MKKNCLQRGALVNKMQHNNNTLPTHWSRSLPARLQVELRNNTRHIAFREAPTRRPFFSTSVPFAGEHLQIDLPFARSKTYSAAGQSQMIILRQRAIHGAVVALDQRPRYGKRQTPRSNSSLNQRSAASVDGCLGVSRPAHKTFIARKIMLAITLLIGNTCSRDGASEYWSRSTPVANVMLPARSACSSCCPKPCKACSITATASASVSRLCASSTHA